MVTNLHCCYEIYGLLGPQEAVQTDYCSVAILLISRLTNYQFCALPFNIQLSDHKPFFWGTKAAHTPYFVALWSGQGLLRRPWPGGPACFLTILTILITVTIQLSMPMLLKFSSPQIEQHLVLIVAS